MTFTDFLKAQSARNDAAGEFARRVLAEVKPPPQPGRRQWHKRIERTIGVGCMRQFTAAWRTWKSQSNNPEVEHG